MKIKTVYCEKKNEFKANVANGIFVSGYLNEG